MVLVAALAACGGQSIRHVDDGAGGEPDDVPPRGGAANGGRGGTGVDPLGGTSFTGGSGGTGGSIAIGGTGAIGTGGTGGTGGTIAIGGTGAIGTGGFGTGGCDSGGPISPPPLAFGTDGIIYPETNPHGISGNWYSFDDCQTASAAGLPCTMRNANVTGPDGLLGWVTGANTVCAHGSAPRVELGPDGTPAYALQWGFGFGFSLNQGAAWNAAAQCVRGFVVDLNGVTPATIRVNIVTPQTIGVAHFVELPVGAGPVLIDFAAAQQGSWVPNRTPLDLTQITDVQFHVYTNEQAPMQYSFCVSDIRAFR